MNKLQIFKNEEFGDIRTVVKDGEPMFCLADVCKALELEQVSRVKTRLKEDGVTTSKVIDRLGREQEATFINESNLYKTIFQSRKDSAERFTDWVTSEVLPEIRKTGTYRKPQTALEMIQLTQKAVIEVDERITAVNKDLQEFKRDMPLLALECQRITRAKNQKIVPLLGGKDSAAYKNASLRKKVYTDIDNQIRRHFGVNTYKAIKRNQCDLVIDLINKYSLPLVLEEQINFENAQMSFA